MFWNTLIAFAAVGLAGLISARTKSAKDFTAKKVISILALVAVFFYSLVSGTFSEGKYYIKDGEVKQVLGGAKQTPFFLKPGDIDKYVTQYTPTAKNPVDRDITLSVTTSDKHTFNLMFKGHYYFIEDFTVTEVQKVIDGEFKDVQMNRNHQEEIEQAIIAELSNYTKEELNSKLFISEKLEKIQEELMKTLPFKIKLYA